jgi:hypothetical protein
MDKELFQRDPRDFALGLVDEGMIDPMMLLQAALNWMSHDEVREMLDANELSPRFTYDDPEDDEEWDGQPDEAQEWHDFDPDC